MACPAQGSKSTFAFITEVTAGTTPAGNMQRIPITSHSLDLVKEVVAGNDISFVDEVERHGNRMVQGDLLVDLRADVYDSLLESALRDTWINLDSTNDQLRIINTDSPKYFSFEDYASDIDQAQLYKGCTVNTMNVSVAPNQMVTTTFGFMGLDKSISATQATLDDFDRAIQPFDSYSGSITLGDSGGSASAVDVTSLDFTLNNNLEHAFVVGDSIAPCITRGRTEITGSFTAHFLDDAIINRFLNETESRLRLTVDDPSAANEYTFSFPRIKINSATTVLEGPGTRVVNVEFKALRETDGGTPILILRPEILAV